MKTILITGAGPHGVTGNRLKDLLKTEYNILNPGSKELDLRDSNAVGEYFSTHKIDYVIHSAVVYPSKESQYSETDENLRMFYNLKENSHLVEKMFYLGSGAEYGKQRDIVNVVEEQIGEVLPDDTYGLFKYKMNEEARRSGNIYNIRLFGTINPNESYKKNLISNLFAKAVKGLPLTLNRNCRFSFVDIDDVAGFIKFGIENELAFHDYNFKGGDYYLSEIADEICRIAHRPEGVRFLQEGLNKEYTGDDSRARAVYPVRTGLSQSLRKVYDRILSIAEEIDPDTIDERWKK